MKLTEQKLRQMIREVIQEDIGYTPDPDVGKNYRMKNKGGYMKSFGPGYSSKEAQSIMDKSVREYAKILRKAQYKIVKDWLTKAKSGTIDFFDVNTALSSGDVSRAHPDELKFLKSVLLRDKIIDRFRSYFGGKKSLPTRKRK